MSFLGILLQVHIAIGYNGDVFPTDDFVIYKGKEFELRNLQDKVQNTCIVLIDVFFQLQMDSFTETELVALEQGLEAVRIHVLILFNVHNLLSGINKKCIGIRNLHKIVSHASTDIRALGAPLTTATNSWEVTIKENVKGKLLWDFLLF